MQLFEMCFNLFKEKTAVREKVFIVGIAAPGPWTANVGCKRWFMNKAGSKKKCSSTNGQSIKALTSPSSLMAIGTFINSSKKTIRGGTFLRLP